MCRNQLELLRGPAALLKQVASELESVLGSPRWRLGDATIGAVNALTFRGSRPTAADVIRSLKTKLFEWEATVLDGPSCSTSVEQQLQRLAEFRDALDRAFRALLASRRWRIGGGLEDVMRPFLWLPESPPTVERVLDLLRRLEAGREDYFRRPVTVISLADAHFVLAELHESEGKWPLAQKAYENALRLAGSRPGILMGLGKVLARRRQWTKALRVFERAIVEGGGAEADRAFILAFEKKWSGLSEGDKVDAQLIGGDPAGAAYFCARARVEAKRRCWRSAIEFYEAAARLDPSCAEGFYGLGQMRERIQHTGPVYTSYAGLVSSREGNWAAAAEAYEAAIALEPHVAKYHFRLGRARERMRDFLGAVKAYEAALGLKKAKYQWIICLARVREQILDLEGALRAYRSVLEYNPNDQQAKSRTIRLLAKLGRWRDLGQYVDESSRGLSGAPGISSTERTLASERSQLYALLRSEAVHSKQCDVRNLLSKRDERELQAMMSVDEWFALHWRLLALGWFPLAYDVKDIAARLIAADTHSAGLGRRLAVAKALVQLGRKEEAMEHLSLLARESLAGDPARIASDALLADIYAFYGDFSHLSQLLILHDGVNLPEAEARFRELIAGRSIAVVGPVDNGVDEGEEIDSLDVVIRTNYFPGKPHSRRARVFGVRADISYFNGVVSQVLSSDIEQAVATRALQMVVLRPLNFMPGRLMIQHPGDLRYNPSESKVMLHARSFAIQRILHDVLRYEPASVKIYKMDFFVSKDAYASDYKAKQLLSGRDPFFRGVGHDYRGDFAFTKRLYKAGLIDAGEVIGRILDLSVEEYLVKLESSFACAAEKGLEALR